MIGLRRESLKPLTKLIRVLSTLFSTVLPSIGDRWALAQCTVVGGLPLIELKPLRLLSNGQWSEKARITCIRVLQIVRLLRGRHPFSILFIM